MATIVDTYEERRLCGYRKPGGKYLISLGPAQTCSRLPIPCESCPTCGAGIKFTRGWTWIDPRPLCLNNPCPNPQPCTTCPLGDPPEKTGLLWIGTRNYRTPELFMAEATRLGISRRLPHVPKGLVLGQTLVLLAHQDVDIEWGKTGVKAIFAAFTPHRLDYIITGKETPEELEEWEKRGFTLIRMHRAEEKPPDPPTS